MNEVMEWIPFSEFTARKKIGQGGFGTVYKAKLKPDNSSIALIKKENYTVALKSCNNFSDFLNEV